MAHAWEEHADRLAGASLAAGDPTGWFERLYAAAVAGEVPMPWDRTVPNRQLAEWVAARRPDGAGRRAVVVGCGLGADAAFVAGLGFTTTGFDISRTAVATARKRFPEAGVDYRVADLLDPPPAWRQAYDLVVEVYTVQALPEPARRRAIPNVAGLLAPGGTLLVVAAARVGGEAAGPPWPLHRDEIGGFATGGVAEVLVEELPDPVDPQISRWRAEYHRPPAAPAPS